jgi:hypothetical protein
MACVWCGGSPPQAQGFQGTRSTPSPPRTTPVSKGQVFEKRWELTTGIRAGDLAVGAAAGARRAVTGGVWRARREHAAGVCFLGDAKSSLGDAKSSLGDAKSSLGDAEELAG